MHREDAGVRQATTLKSAIMSGLYQTGMLRAFQSFSRSYEIAAHGERSGRLRRVQGSKYLVLGYHRVGTEGPPLYSTLPQSVFAAQMRYLKQHFRIISVAQMVRELQHSERQDQAVVITFDDGYAGTFTEAFPVLREYEIPATVYLTGAAIETGDVSWYDCVFLRVQQAESPLEVELQTHRRYALPTYESRLQAAEEIVGYLRSLPDEERSLWCAEFAKRIPLPSNLVRGAMLTWEQVRAMQRNGITFGAHTMSHPVVSRLGADILHEELRACKELIEQRLGTTVDEFAFPFGKSSDCGFAAAETLKELGFTSAMTTILGVNQPGVDPYRLRRAVVSNDTLIPRFAWHVHRQIFHPVDEELTVNLAWTPSLEIA